jgi:histidine kinase
MKIRKLFRSHLNIKLFLAFFIVVVVGAIVLITATEFIMPIAFETHLQYMQDALNDPTKTEQALNDDLFNSFRNAVYSAMKFAIPSSLVAALVISLSFSHQFISQISKMLDASKKISQGDFKERITLPRNLHPDEMDELNQLAIAFNQMTEKLDKNDRLRRELIGDVSHELRTPLAFINASIESIADGVIAPSPETLAEIQEELDRLTRLVNDLQELSIYESGAYSLHKRQSNLNEIILSVVNQINTPDLSKHIQFNTEFDNTIPDLMIDPDRIKQVLTNLLSNALNFTAAGGQISLFTIQEDDDHIKVVVRDTGVGIPKSDLSRIFTRFYRVDHSRSRESGGSGIGLTIAQQLIEAHGGKIWADSPGLGKGTSIIFTLPVK